jgi:hypothetical protein
MRLALLVQVVATALLLCGCPGSEENAAGSGNTANSSGASGQGGEGQGGAGQGGEGQGGAGGGTSAACALLENDLNVKLEEAQTCNPAIDIVQCADVVAGVCCEVIVGKKDSPEVQAYLEALEKYKGASCTPTCPPVRCPAAPTGTCKPSGSGSGQCMQQP